MSRAWVPALVLLLSAGLAGCDFGQLKGIVRVSVQAEGSALDDLATLTVPIRQVVLHTRPQDDAFDPESKRVLAPSQDRVDLLAQRGGAEVFSGKVDEARYRKVSLTLGEVVATYKSNGTSLAISPEGRVLEIPTSFKAQPVADVDFLIVLIATRLPDGSISLDIAAEKRGPQATS